MSFHTAAALAASYGVPNIAALIIGNPADEKIATAILLEAMPTSLGDSYSALVRVAETKQGLQVPEDVCMHCVLTEMGLPADAATMANLRRIAMFDVPRSLFAEKHGLWLYWLFDEAFILAPTKTVNMDWAFQRHAYRLMWEITKQEPLATPTAEAARDYVQEHLTSEHAAGLARVKTEATNTPSGQLIDVPDGDPVMPHYLAWIGSVTGGELLRQALGMQHRMVTYNCHAAQPNGPEDKAGQASAPGKPSIVLQLQMQDPNSIHC